MNPPRVYDVTMPRSEDQKDYEDRLEHCEPFQ